MVSNFVGVPFEYEAVEDKGIVSGIAPSDSQAVQLLSHEMKVQAVSQGAGGTFNSPYSMFNNSTFNGDKFFGGYGSTELQYIDYWALRARSSQLFNENLYARGLLRRLITNEINTGLTPEVSPDEKILGFELDSLSDWSETVESLFAIWGNDPRSCDWRHMNTFGAIQRAARLESLISGDVLVFLRRSSRTGLPIVELISGDRVQNPLDAKAKARKGNRITLGVETDSVGRVQAYWVNQLDIRSFGSSRRIPAFGSRSGKRIAWLLFGTDKRLNDLRGQPILSLIMQSLKEIDRYRDSVQRKAVITSTYAMFMKKTEDKPGSGAFRSGAIRRDVVDVTEGDGGLRQFVELNNIPGVIMSDLQQGEEPVAFNANGTDEKFSEFEAAIVSGLSWANEIPPEIMTLAFSNNYSASQAAINEFKIYLNMIWAKFGEEFCSPIYTEWLVNKTLMGDISSPGLAESMVSSRRIDDFGAWRKVLWYGSIKPSTDMLKQAKGSALLVEHGWSTNEREARGITGTKFLDNVAKLERENIALAKAVRPMLELKAEFGEVAVSQAQSNATGIADEVVTALQLHGNIE